jgi:hypothetical protein
MTDVNAPRSGHVISERRLVLRRIWAGLIAAALTLSMSSVALASGAEAATTGCRTTDQYATYGWPGGIRAARVHLVARWCWDGRTVTATYAPYTYFTATKVGSFYADWTETEIKETWEDPQYGGHWTRVIRLKGKINVSVFKYGHIKTIPVNLDLKLFGDGVAYGTTY